MCEKLPLIPVESLDEIKKLSKGSYIAFADPREIDFDALEGSWGSFPDIVFIPRQRIDDSPPIEIYRLD